MNHERHATKRAWCAVGTTAFILALTPSALCDTYSNGGVNLQPGGCNGAPYSAIEAPSTLFGNNTIVTAWHQADNFIVPQGETWTLSQLTWKLYQSNSSPNEPIQAFYVRVWDGNPMQGGAPIGGDMTTNRLIDSEFAGYYRVSQTDTSSCARAVKKVTADMSWLGSLDEGEYWIEVGSEGNDAFSGPWANHVVPRDGNEGSINYDVTANTWQPNTSNGVGWDYPFTFEYTTANSIELLPYPFLRLSGTCPGPVTVSAEYCTPGGNVALLYSFQEGLTTIPQSMPCSGTVLSIRNPTIAGTARADANGVAMFQGNIPRNACDRMFLQALDVETCTPSEVELVEEGAQETVKRCKWIIDCRLVVTPRQPATTNCDDDLLALLDTINPILYYGARCPPNNCTPAVDYFKMQVRYKKTDEEGVKTCWVMVKRTRTGECVEARPSALTTVQNALSADCRRTWE